MIVCPKCKFGSYDYDKCNIASSLDGKRMTFTCLKCGESIVLVPLGK